MAMANLMSLRVDQQPVSFPLFLNGLKVKQFTQIVNILGGKSIEMSEILCDKCYE